jgi:hypothetical protein
MGTSVTSNGDLRMRCLWALVLLSGKCLFCFVVHCIAFGYSLWLWIVELSIEFLMPEMTRRVGLDLTGLTLDSSLPFLCVCFYGGIFRALDFEFE